MLTRRGFLARVCAAPIVALALLKAPIERRHPFAFEPFEAPALEDRQTGISIRFIQQWDIQADRMPTRFDWVWLAPNL